jgi:hypothetical protein
MFRYSRFLLIVLLGTSLLTVVGTGGCSRKEEEPPRAKVEVPAEQAAEEQSDEADSSGAEPHQVDACQRHRYYIAPGESATVTFETEVKSDVAKAARDEEPSVNKEAMEAAGYSVSYASRSIDTFSRSRPVWTVYNSDFAAKERESIFQTTTAGVSIRWQTDGSGVIEKLGQVKGPFEVGKLTSEDLAKALGGETVRSVGPGNKMYTLSPTLGSMDQETNILSVTLHVTVPKDTDKIMQEKIGGVSWKGGGIGFRGYYSSIPGVQKYIIVGPAKDRDCFDP